MENKAYNSLCIHQDACNQIRALMYVFSIIYHIRGFEANTVVKRLFLNNVV